MSPVITRYGYDVVGVVVVVFLAGFVASWYFLDDRVFRFSGMLLFALVLAFSLYFFRDPDRTTPVEAGMVISPADGKVLFVKDVAADEYVNGDAVQISIFMSPAIGIRSPVPSSISGISPGNF